ncbi:DnaJ family molecular chaperone [Bacteroidota bacterium]
MGQILNRMFRIAKSYSNDRNLTNEASLSKDEELKRIIEELNKKKQHHHSEDKRNKNKVLQAKKIDIEEAYGILKIEKNAGIDEIKSGYKKRIKEYHPDRLENFGDEIKELARIKTREINMAYSMIKNEKGF